MTTTKMIAIQDQVRDVKYDPAAVAALCPSSTNPIGTRMCPLACVLFGANGDFRSFYELELK